MTRHPPAKEIEAEELLKIVEACAVIVYVTYAVMGKEGLKRLVEACEMDQMLEDLVKP